jgi:RNA polymerase sigma-70 factor, ECF subfamily
VATLHATSNAVPSGPEREALAQAVRRARTAVDSAAGFRALEAHLAPRLLRYFRGHSFSREDAEDLAQAVFARVWQGLPGLEQEEKFLPWLFAIARNVRHAAWQHRKRERRWRADDGEGVEHVPDPRSMGFARTGLEAERLEAVQVAIDDLPAQQRVCLLLRVREELSYEEISETLRLSLHTVRNHLAAAKRNLRQRLRLHDLEARR